MYLIQYCLCPRGDAVRGLPLEPGRSAPRARVVPGRRGVRPAAPGLADTDVSSSLFQQALNHTGWNDVKGFLTNTGGSDCDLDIDVVGQTTDICADVATGPVSLIPGQSAIIYFKLTNGTLTSLDSGVNTSVNIYAGKAGSPQSVTVKGES